MRGNAVRAMRWALFRLTGVLLRLSKLGDFVLCQFAPFADLEIAEAERAHTHTNEAFDRMTEGGAHVADLAFLAFVQNDAEPRFVASCFAVLLIASRTLG